MKKNEILVRHLKKNTKVLPTSRLEAAFRAVDRRDFVPEEYRVEAYEDYPLPIGAGQTISQPTTVAFMLEKLGVKEGDHVLDVGAGSGWTTALLARLAGEAGEVWGLERVPELVRFGGENLKKYCFNNAAILQAGPTVGLPAHAPYDRILVSAATERIPKELLSELAPGGTLVIPVAEESAREHSHAIVVVTKSADGKLAEKRYSGFAFVPLIA